MSHKNAIQIVIPVLVLIAAACSCFNTPAFTASPTATTAPAVVQAAPTASLVQSAPTVTPIPATPTIPPNSICGWIENTSTTGVMAPTMKLWDSGKVLKLYMLEMDAIDKLNYTAPAWYRVMDPVYQDPDLLVNFSSIEKVQSCP